MNLTNDLNNGPGAGKRTSPILDWLKGFDEEERASFYAALQNPDWPDSKLTRHLRDNYNFPVGESALGKFRRDHA